MRFISQAWLFYLVCDMKKIHFVILLVLLFAGCAINSYGYKQTIYVDVVNESADAITATCELKNKIGTWYLLSPGSVEILSSKSALSIICEKTSYESSTVLLEAVKSTSRLLNLLASSESFNAYLYQSNVKIKLRKKTIDVSSGKYNI